MLFRSPCFFFIRPGINWLKRYTMSPGSFSTITDHHSKRARQCSFMHRERKEKTKANEATSVLTGHNEKSMAFVVQHQHRWCLLRTLHLRVLRAIETWVSMLFSLIFRVACVWIKLTVHQCWPITAGVRLMIATSDGNYSKTITRWQFHWWDNSCGVRVSSTPSIGRSWS